MDPVNPSDKRVNSVLDQGGAIGGLFGYRPGFDDVKYLMTQTETRPAISDEEIIALLKSPSSQMALAKRATAHKNYWNQIEKEANKVKADEAIAKEKAKAAPPGGNTPTPVTGSANSQKKTPATGTANSQRLQEDPRYQGRAYEPVEGYSPDEFLKVYPIKMNGKEPVKDNNGDFVYDFQDPRFYYVGNLTVEPEDITNFLRGSDKKPPATPAQYKAELIKSRGGDSSGGGSGSGGGGGGGYIAPATTYSIQQIGGKVYSIGSDGKRELTDIDPGYAKYEVNRLGDLYGFRADGTSTKLQSGWDFAKQDPALVVQRDNTTGESFLVNTRDPSQPKQLLGKFDFATIDPERTAAEAALQSRLGLASSERAGDQSAALSGRATDINAASNARTQDITLQGQQFNNALDLQKYVNGLINSPTDFVNRGRLSAGLAPLGGGRITQADLVNAAKNAMGSQNFQTVRDALLPTPFVTAAKTPITDFSKPAGTTPTGTTPTVPAIPLMPTGGAVSQANFDRMQAYARNQPAPVNPVNPNQNTWTVGQNPTTQEQVLINMQNAGLPNFMIQQQLQSMGLMPAPAPVPTPVTSSQNTQMLSSDNAPDAGPLGAPAAASAPATAQESAEHFAGKEGLSSTFGGAGPAVTSDDTYGMESLSNSTAPGDDTSFPDYAYGGATRDERFIVGDRRDGRPAGTEEMIINPTRAPIQVVPNSRLAAYYGGTMPNHFAGGTDSRLGMYPRYDKGTDAINLLSNLFGKAKQGLGYGAQNVGNALRYGAENIGSGIEYGLDRAIYAATSGLGMEESEADDAARGRQHGFNAGDNYIGKYQTREEAYNDPRNNRYGRPAAEIYDYLNVPPDGFENPRPYRPARYRGQTKNYIDNFAEAYAEGVRSANQRKENYEYPNAGYDPYSTFPGYAYGTDSRLGMYPRYADGVLPSVQGAPAGSLSPVTQEDLVNTAREYSPPAVSSLLGDRGAFEARMLPVQSASMRQTNNLTADEAAALGTRLALEGTSQQEYNALQKGLFGQQRTTRRGRLVV